MNERPPYGLAVMVGLVVLGLYAITLAPTTQFWDTSEYIAAAKVLGIPHPPGNPLFVLLANVWGKLIPLADYGARINLFAATTSAVAAFCWFLISERWLRDIIPVVTVRRIAAGAGTLVAATAFTVWNQSVVNAKVYTISLMSIALVMWLGVRWTDTERGWKRDRLLLLMLYLLVLTSTNHMMGALAAPAIAVLVAFHLWDEQQAGIAEMNAEWAKLATFVGVVGVVILLGLESPKLLMIGAALLLLGTGMAVWTKRWEFAVLAVAAGVIGLSVNGILPIRAALYPPINEGEPTNWDALWSVLTREQYGKPSILDDPTWPGGRDNPGRGGIVFAQYHNYWQYFTWQWSRTWQLLNPGRAGQSVAQFLGVIFAGIGLLGGWRQWRSNKRDAAAMMMIFLTLIIVLVFYLNFRYGFSLYPDRPDLATEVRERDYFFIASFAAWGVWVGLGLATLLEWLKDVFSRSLGDERAWMAGTPIFLIALIPLVGNWHAASRANETLARDFARDILNGVEPYSILVTAGDNDTFPLWYAQEVEGVRRDVIVLNLSLGNTLWHLRQVLRREIEEYDAEAGPAIFRDREWQKPTKPLFSWDMGQIDPTSARWAAGDSIPLYVSLPERRIFTAGRLRTTVDPNRLPGGLLDRATIAVLEAIRNTFPERPFYFSRTAGGLPDQLGFTPYLATQGFARKLFEEPIVPSDSNMVYIQSYGTLDVERTRELLWNVYHGETAARQRPVGWYDVPSESILTLYGIAYSVFAQAIMPVDSALAAASAARADSILTNTSFGRQPSLFRPID